MAIINSKLPVLGSAAVEHGQLAGRQQDRAAVVAVNLLLEEEVGGQTLGLRRIDAARLVAKREAAGGRLAVHVLNGEFHRDGRSHGEEDRHFAAEARILAALADVETEGRFALARLAALDEGQRVLRLQAAQVGGHRLLGEYFDVEETFLVGLQPAPVG